MPSPASIAEKLTPDSEVREIPSVFCSWGRLVAECATKEGWFPKARIEVTGCPRYDFHADPWNAVALSGNRNIDDLPRPIILLNTRFSLANPETASPDKHAEVMAKVLKRPVEQIKDWQAVLNQSLEDMVTLANHLAVQFPDASVVLRPHPFERVSTYEPLLRARPNLHLRRDGTIEEWLAHTTAVIHRCCSTAIDAGMRGIPAFSARWIRMNEEIESVEQASVQCDSPAQLSSELEHVISGQFSMPPKAIEGLQKTIADWFYASDGLSHTRVADAIESVLGTATDTRGACRAKYREVMNKIHRNSGTIASRCLSQLARLLGWPEPEVPETQDGTEDGIRRQGKWKAESWAFGASEVEDLLARLGACDGRGFRARQERIGFWPGRALASVRLERE